MRDELKKLLDGDVVQTPKALRKYSHDTSLFEVKPELVVFPKNVKDLRKLVRYATHQKKKDSKISLTARSGGTDMSGGAVNDSIIIAFEKYFTHTGNIKNNKIKVEPGVYYRDFDAKTQRYNKMMPSYPASREIAAVGGMVANNAGGEKSLVYGKTEKYIPQLKVILADGNEHILKPINKKQLDKKMKESTFEGQLYKKIFNIVDKNYDFIKKSKPPVTKNSTAYNLWNVWDRENDVFDLTQLFAGSQGTLGLVSEIEFKLVDVKPKSGMVVGYLESMGGLGDVIHTVLRHKPTSFEVFDDQTIKFAMRFFLQFRKTLGWWGLFKLAISFLPDAFILLRGGLPKLIFMVEFEGDTQDEIENKLHDLNKDLEPYDAITELAKSITQEKRFWLMRRESFNLLRKNVKGKHTAPFIDDIVVPAETVPEFIPRIEKIIKKYDLLETLVGHIGDGNFHIIPLMDLTDQKERDKIEPCLREVIRLVKEFNGTISGEHNDGLIRGPFIDDMYGDKMYKLFKEVKSAFDPHKIFNPHKKTDANWGFSKRHIRDHF